MEDSDAADNPDPALSWDELVMLYSTGLERKIAEVDWDDFCKEIPSSACVVEVPRANWWKWNQKHLPNQHKIRQFSGSSRAPQGETLECEQSTAQTTAKQAFRINSEPVLNDLRQMTQQSIWKAIITAPFKEIWILDHVIQNRLDTVRAQVQDTVADKSILPFRSQQRQTKTKENMGAEVQNHKRATQERVPHRKTRI